MIIRRYAYVRSTEIYEVQIDQDYVDSITEQIRKRLPEGDTFEALTVEEVNAAWTDTDEFSRNTEIVRQKCNKYNVETKEYETYFYPSELGDMLREWISEDLWDSHTDMYDSEIDDWEDTVIEE